MDDALGMHNHLDPAQIDAEEPVCLDDLQPFVHHGGRVDGDPLAHGPGGMAQRLFRGDVRKGLFRSGTERTSRCGEEDPADLFGPLACKALEDGRMLGIDRDQGRPVSSGLLCEEGAADDQGLLVGQGQDRSLPHGLQRRQESSRPGYAVHHDVRPGHGDDIRGRRFTRDDAPLARNAACRGSQGSDIDAELVRLLLEEPGICAGRQARDLEFAGPAPDDVKGGSADRAGRAEDDYRFHLLQHPDDEIEENPHRNDSVHAVEHAAVAWDQAAHVLDVEVSLVHGRAQVSREVQDADGPGKDRNHPERVRCLERQETGIEEEEQARSQNARRNASEQTFHSLLGTQAGRQRVPAQILANVVRSDVRKEGGQEPEDHPEPAVDAVSDQNPEAQEPQGIDEAGEGEAHLPGCCPAFLEEIQPGDENDRADAAEGEKRFRRRAHIYSIEV